MNLKNIFEYLKNHRGLTQSQIAKDIGLSRQSVHHHVTKKHDPTIDLINQLAEVYEIEPQTLFDQLYKEQKKSDVENKEQNKLDVENNFLTLVKSHFSN